MSAADIAVAITGLGILSPIGIGHERFWAALCDGVSGIRSLPGATEIPHVGAQLVDYLPRDFIASAHLRRMDNVSRALVSAAKMATQDVPLSGDALVNDRTGIVVGSALGNIAESVQYLERLFTKGPSLVSPMQFPNLVLNAAASYAAMETVSTGINFTVTDGEVSAEQAFLLAVDVLRRHQADVVIAGAADEWADIVVHAYRRMRALAGQRGGPEECRPFDARRNGIVLGEGAATVVLEPLRNVEARGGRSYAVVEGIHSFTIPSSPYGWPTAASTAASTVRVWLHEVVADIAGIDLIIANANGSPVLDGFLLDVLLRVFGESAAQVALTSIRGAVGEFGAAGALSIVTACLALHHQMVPPLCHVHESPTGAGFQFVAPRAAARRVERVLHLSVARGGAALAVLLRRP